MGVELLDDGPPTADAPFNGAVFVREPTRPFTAAVAPASFAVAVAFVIPRPDPDPKLLQKLSYEVGPLLCRLFPMPASLSSAGDLYAVSVTGGFSVEGVEVVLFWVLVNRGGG